MTCTMAYASLPDNESLVNFPITALMGAAVNQLLCGWLEDPWREDGFRLRDDVMPNEIAALIEAWPEGRVFHDAADLRWEHQSDGSIYVVFIGDDEPPALFRGRVPLVPTADHETSAWLLLWGTKVGDEWMEDRIPSIGSLYPDTWRGPHAAVRVRYYESEWTQSDAGIRRVTRYLGFDGAHQPVQLRQLRPAPLTSFKET